jgi:hypothetical protein
LPTCLNIAACSIKFYEKFKQPSTLETAEKYCSKALTADPGNCKALEFRGRARVEMGKRVNPIFALFFSKHAANILKLARSKADLICKLHSSTQRLVVAHESEFTHEQTA